jgi:hypothetical protein
MRTYTTLTFLFLTCLLAGCGEGDQQKPSTGQELSCHNTPAGCSPEDMKKATGFNQ